MRKSLVFLLGTAGCGGAWRGPRPSPAAAPCRALPPSPRTPPCTPCFGASAPRALAPRMRASSDKALIERVPAWSATTPTRRKGTSCSRASIRRRPDQRADVAEKIIRKLRAGMMPPAGARAPARRRSTRFAASLETKLDAAADAPPESRPPDVPAAEPRRIHRARSATCCARRRRRRRSCRPTPSATTSTTSPTCRSMSPTLLEGYLRAASQISRWRWAIRSAQPDRATYKVPRTAVADARTSTARRSARAAASRSCTISRRTASTPSA